MTDDNELKSVIEEIQRAEDEADAADAVTAATKGRLKTIIERIENVEEEEAGLRAGKKEIYAEAKGEGFDTKAIRKLISLRKKDKAKREEEEAILELYILSLGGID